MRKSLNLAIDGAIAAAIPEYMKRENVLALSTASGDAYLLQVYLFKWADNNCTLKYAKNLFHFVQVQSNNKSIKYS